LFLTCTACLRKSTVDGERLEHKHYSSHRMALLMTLALPALSGTLYVIALVMFANLHQRASDTNWLRDPVSNYGVSRARAYFRIYGHVGTAAAVLLAIQFALTTTAKIQRVAVVCMGLLLLLRVGVIHVPTDRPGMAKSTMGRVHLLFAIATFAVTYIAVASATPALDAVAPAWLAVVLSYTRIAAMLSLVGVVVTMLAPLRRVFGLTERAFLLTTMLWFLAANVEFLLATGTA